MTLAWFVARSLHGQLDRFLQAARRIGAGDFDARVPTVGNDDFAALGGEFNRWPGSSRAGCTTSASSASACARRSAGSARRSPRTSTATRCSRSSSRARPTASARMRGAPRCAGTPAEPIVAVAETGDVAAFAEPAGRGRAAHLRDRDRLRRRGRRALRARAAAARPRRRDDRDSSRSRAPTAPFTPAERELFDYLAGQAATSIENVELHERVERQAVTDVLTGLANRRRFEERLDEEVERARRFPEPLSLLMLDIDDFKLVNDRFGHIAGDEVLRVVARTLREAARDIDLAARYGGEELTLILPGADLDGAFRVGERVREAIEKLDQPVRDADGAAVRVTVSVGVAALGDAAPDARGARGRGRRRALPGQAHGQEPDEARTRRHRRPVRSRVPSQVWDSWTTRSVSTSS